MDLLVVLNLVQVSTVKNDLIIIATMLKFIYPENYSTYSFSLLCLVDLVLLHFKQVLNSSFSNIY